MGPQGDDVEPEKNGLSRILSLKDEEVPLFIHDEVVARKFTQTVRDLNRLVLGDPTQERQLALSALRKLGLR